MTTSKKKEDEQVAPAPQGSFMPQMSPEQFTQLMQTVIAEAKKPYGEDELKAKMEKLREQMRADVAEYNEEVKQRQLRCGHLRVDDGKTTIAWMPTGHKPCKGVSVGLDLMQH